MADVVAQAKQALESVGSDEIEALQEEMESWRDNMSGTNLETTSKYERVDEAASSLEDIASTVGDLDAAPEPEEGESVEDYHSRLLEIADELENATSDLEGVDFPGAFG
jgi:methyl-accepting chemotaxis protein